MPSGCLYTSQEFIDKNPNTTQALANAIVRADKWIQASSPDEIAKVVPKGYLLGDPDLYKLALTGNKEALSPDGRSEEHTSELQSLMRISYAVFCLKKKITNKN